MSTPRGWPGKQNFPAINGRFVVDTYRGKMRVRAWPKPRGKPKSRAQQIAIDRFTAANRLAKEAPGEIQNQCIEATKGSGLYPRDLLVRAILSGWYEIHTDDGRLIRHGRPQVETKVFQGFILRQETGEFRPANTGVPLSWPLPIRDTAGFWNPASPGIITIPEGVAIMSFFAGNDRAGGGFSTMRMSIGAAGVNPGNRAVHTVSTTNRLTLATGPVLVDQGQTWSVVANASSSYTTNPSATFFGGVIEAAEI